MIGMENSHEGLDFTPRRTCPKFSYPCSTYSKLVFGLHILK